LHAEHARRSVASGKAQYALYDEKTKKLYLLGSDQPSAVSAQRTANSAPFDAEPWLGQRVRVTGKLSAAPITRAGESYAPDAVATVRDSDPSGAATPSGQAGAQRPVSATAADPNPGGAGAGAAGAASSAPTPRIQRHAKALDTSTPVAGTLAVTSIEAAPR
jgi:hypothetical protein